MFQAAQECYVGGDLSLDYEMIMSRGAGHRVPRLSRLSALSIAGELRSLLEDVDLA